jgi:RNA polymerase sigma-70 factor (ECF subfamily)
MDEDLALLERYEEGDEGAFTELVSRYQQPLYRTAYRMVGHTEDALDLVQQTFVQLFVHRSRFRGEAKLKSWVYQILINLCRNHLRHSGRHHPVELEGEEENLRETRTPLDPLLDKASQREVQRAIQQLPERQRATLVLRAYEEYPFEQIAEILGCHIGTAKANYHHAFRKLSALLEEKNDRPSRD